VQNFEDDAIAARLDRALVALPSEWRRRSLLARDQRQPSFERFTIPERRTIKKRTPAARGREAATRMARFIHRNRFRRPTDTNRSLPRA
jgi:hypothetical protein